MPGIDGLEQFFPPVLALAQVIVIDTALAGDNALVIGMAASRVEPRRRHAVMLWGIGGAVVIRLVFALMVTRLLSVLGLTLAGGILLLWVCWKIFRELRQGAHLTTPAAGNCSFRHSVWQIIVADISMSLDNVLAVAGAAKGDLVVLVAGLGLSILLTALAANLIAKILSRHAWITWLGLAVVISVALEMIWRGFAEVTLRAGTQ